MLQNYIASNSLEFYSVGELYAFPVNTHLAGIQLTEEQESAYAAFIALLGKAGASTNSEMDNQLVRIAGVVVDKERDRDDARITVIMHHGSGYEYKKYSVDYMGAASDANNSLRLVDTVTYSPNATVAQIGQLATIAPSLKAPKHTGLVEKNNSAEKHTGLVEIETASGHAKHTGLVEADTVSGANATSKTATSEAKHTGLVEI